ncbi:unnamed protein product, partial [Mesorhabditis spiculigera]
MALWKINCLTLPRLPVNLAVKKSISQFKNPPNLTIRDEALGNLIYSRNISRNNRFAAAVAPQQGDTPLRFLTRRLGHAYEVYPLLGLMGFWVALVGVFGYLSLTKVELWIDRSTESAPWDWSRIRNNYWKKQTFGLGQNFESTHKRLPIMEQLQDEMLEAAKQRGTRH